MSPDLALPHRGSPYRLVDVAAVAVILLFVAMLLPPAIHASRFHARLASCQERLRQVGLGLAQYGYDHGSPLSELVDNERLTDAGQFAAELLDDGVAAGDGHDLCPDAWLAAQGASRWSRHIERWLAGISIPPTEAADAGPALPATPLVETAGMWNVGRDAWSGAWHDRISDEANEPAPAVVVLLADVPGVEASYQVLDWHDGQGRNMFFEDGHVDFLSYAAPRHAAEAIMPVDDIPIAGVSVPITMTSWR